MTKAHLYRNLAAGAGVVLLTALAQPATAQDGYYRTASCYDRNADASAGGAVTGAVVGGVAAGPIGAVVGAAVGGSAGDDSVNCRYERDGYSYRNGYGDDYQRGYSYRSNDGEYRQDANGYGSTYREGYSDGYADASQRFNGSDRGYRQDDDYYARRSTYRPGYYDGYGFWHPASDNTRRH